VGEVLAGVLEAAGKSGARVAVRGGRVAVAVGIPGMASDEQADSNKQDKISRQAPQEKRLARTKRVFCMVHR
jgi:hypothetical protein